MGNTLSLALPTYNRADFLDKFLAIHLPFLSAHDIRLVISDNASPDNTREVVERHAAKYAVIDYHRNEVHTLPDENFETVLKLAETDYVWLIGDTYQVSEAEVMAVKQAIDEDSYDLLVLNLSGHVSDISEQVYTDGSKLLADLGWLMTCLSTMVYSRHLIAQGNYARFRDSSFLQEGIVFEYLAGRQFRVKWMPDCSIRGISLDGIKKISGDEQRLELWAKRWANFVFSLPVSYGFEAKLSCVKSFSANTGKLGFKNIKLLRKAGAYNLAIYRQYASALSLTTDCPRFLLRFLAIFPIWLLRLFGSRP